MPCVIKGSKILNHLGSFTVFEKMMLVYHIHLRQRKTGVSVQMCIRKPDIQLASLAPWLYKYIS